MIFNRRTFEQALAIVASMYEKAAPTVADYADAMASAKDDAITLADLMLIQNLAEQRLDGNLAANLVYHRMQYAGRSTVGHAGF